MNPHNSSSLPDFSIITPSLNMLPYLQRCSASIADQANVTCEHLVQDAHSNDGSGEWLAAQPSILEEIKSDRGMYDALNNGIDRAQGEIVAYLNCDEQYLEGTLEHVRDVFNQNPATDLLFGHALLVRPDNTLISYRKAYQPRLLYLRISHLYVLSCTMFIRRRVFKEGFRFQANLRDIADWQFVMDCLQKKYIVCLTDRYLTAFTMTGQNMSASENASKETQRVRDRLPLWMKLAAPVINILRLGEKALSGAYRQKFPFSYALYEETRLDTRRTITAAEGSFRWKFE